MPAKDEHRGRYQYSVTALLVVVTLLVMMLAAYRSTGVAGLVLVVWIVPLAIGLWKSNPAWITVAIGGVLLALFVALPLLRLANRRIAHQSCSANLRIIASGLSAYHQVHGSFPPAYVADETGRPLHSWRVLLLPYVGHQDLYERYRFDEPWNGPHNRRLAKRIPAVFQCPHAEPHNQLTHYVTVVGDETAWPPESTVSIKDITDGRHGTVILVESHACDIHWMEPRDLDFGVMSTSVNAANGPCISSPHEGGAQVVLLDGTVRLMATHTRPDVVRGVLTIAGGESLGITENYAGEFTQ